MNVYQSGRNVSKKTYKGRPCTYSVSGAPSARIVTLHDREHEKFAHFPESVLRNNGVKYVATCLMWLGSLIFR
jgi:hypothetical protein